MFMFQKRIIPACPIFNRFFRAIIHRPMLDLAVQLEQEEGKQHDINDGEKDQGKDDLVGADSPRQRIGGSQHTIYHPGLAAHFSSKPTGLIGHLRQEYAEREDPKQPATVEELFSPPEPAAIKRKPDHGHAHGDHEMVKLKD